MLKRALHDRSGVIASLGHTNSTQILRKRLHELFTIAMSDSNLIILYEAQLMADVNVPTLVVSTEEHGIVSIQACHCRRGRCVQSVIRILAHLELGDVHPQQIVLFHGRAHAVWNCAEIFPNDGALRAMRLDREHRLKLIGRIAHVHAILRPNTTWYPVEAM